MKETKDCFTSDEAKDLAVKAIEQAQESDRWMVAVWHVKDGRVELLNKTTWKFPRGDFLAATGQLALNCHEETVKHALLPSEPLPRASLFGQFGLPPHLIDPSRPPVEGGNNG